MELNHSFTVPAGLEETWEAFGDLASIAECFPGATVTESDGDTFKGTAKVGEVLTAVAGSTTPAAATVKYQWLLNGKAIKGATKSKLKLKAAYLGKKISLQVTYSSTGFTSLVTTTKAKKVKAAAKKH